MAMIIILLSLLGTSFGNPDNFIYTDNCKPPPGFESNDTDVTTPDYITLRPIERCCPQCDQCAHLGGSCALKWAVDLYPKCCDFAPAEPCRDYSCKCCIKCGDDKCSPCVETGGECRKECRAGELEDPTNLCNYYHNGTGCKCCKKCEATSECTEKEGTCVTNPVDCPLGTYASTGCCGGCYCCKPVLVPYDGGCDIDGAYCSETSDCANGFYSCFGACIKTLFNAGLQSTELGFCCLPKQTASPGGGNRIEELPFFVDQQKDTRKHPRQLFN